MSDETEESEFEEESDDVPYVEFDISVSPSDPTLELLHNQIKRKDIIVPFYQRGFVWKIEQASELIESFLMGLPVPQVFLYVNDKEQLEIIDGQQRILSVSYFFEGYFGEADSRGKRQVFRLKGLSQRSEYNGRTFEELSVRDQRKIRNSTLRAINIKQMKPKGSNESVYHIFKRLNTGGTKLKPQEIRNAVYRGPIVDLIKYLNSYNSWQSILGLSRPDKSQKDAELVLRLMSLFDNHNQYEKPMLSFLNNQMDKNRAADSERLKRFAPRFRAACDLVAVSLAKPFRPKGVINTSILEAVMICIIEAKSPTPEKVQAFYTKLLDDNSFVKTISGATTDTLVLKERIRIAKELFENA